MSVVWKKIWRDVMERKGRTFQVVLSIGVGIFALGLTMGLLDIVEDRMTFNWSSSEPGQIILPVGSGVDDDVIRAIGNLPGIEDAEGMTGSGFRWKVNLDDPWLSANVFARTDYSNLKYDRLKLLEGTWPSRGAMVVERGSQGKYNVPLSGTIYLEVDEKPHPINVVGVVYDAHVPPPVFTSDASFYVTRREMERLGRSSDYDQIKAVLPVYDEDTAKKLAVDINDRLELLDIGHGTAEINDPQRHFIQDTVNGIFMILVVMSVLTLAMSLFLVINTITAIVTEQVPQIGIMKAIGARSLQIFRIYLSNVLVYVVIALLIAIPLGVIGSRMLSGVMLGLFNMDVVDLKFPLKAVMAQLALGFTSPLIAALWPVTAGARTTVRDAVSGYGLSIRAGLVDRGLARLRRLPPLLVMTVANTFRNKGRLSMTLIALVVGGAIFMMVISVRASMLGFFDEFLEIYRFDVILGFEQSQRIDAIETLVGGLPGIEYAEVLQFSGESAIRRIDDREELDEKTTELIGVSKDGRAYQADLRAGRFLLPEDEKSIVLNQNLAKELGVTIGDDVIIEINDEDTIWKVVGLLFDINADQTASVVWLDVLLREQKQAGRARTLFIGAENTDSAQLSRLSRDLRDWLDAQGKDVGFSLTSTEFKSENVGGLMIIVWLLAVLAVLIAAVGAVGLSGALSINALERQKEIGVMRAIGASSRAIGGIFIGEGVLIGLLSWLIALPISYPLGLVFSGVIGSTIDFDFGFKYSLAGAGIWLAIVVLLSILASGLPAWRATRTSVREVLAYA